MEVFEVPKKRKRRSKKQWAGRVHSFGKGGSKKTTVLITDAERKRGERRLKRSK